MRYLLSLFAILVAGCAHPDASYKVRVSSSGTGLPARYCLAPANPEIGPNDRQFRAYAACAHRILQNQGFTPADTQSADQVILLEYGVGMPSARAGIHQHIAYVPNPSYEFTGQNERFQAIRDAYDAPADFYSIWPRYVAFFAYDADKLRQSRGQVKVQLWSTTATSFGRSPDLRQAMPALMAAAQKHLGTPMRRAKHILITQSDPPVLVKGIGPIPPPQLHGSPPSETAWDLLLSQGTHTANGIDNTMEWGVAQGVPGSYSASTGLSTRPAAARTPYEWFDLPAFGPGPK